MYEYINKILTELSDMNGVFKTPAAGHLFNISPDAKKLPEDKVQLFHHLVAKLLYLCRCTRQDIHAVTLLYTRVKETDKYGYKKLVKVMQYIRGTRELTLTIEPSKDWKWWVDSLYTVHLDMRIHTGVVMILGKELPTPHQPSKNSTQKAQWRPNY